MRGAKVNNSDEVAMPAGGDEQGVGQRSGDRAPFQPDLLAQEGDPCARLRQYAHMAMQMFLEQGQLLRLFLRLLDLIIHQPEQVKRLDPVRHADRLIIAPSNPVISIGPILAVPGVRQAAGRHGRRRWRRSGP